MLDILKHKFRFLIDFWEENYIQPPVYIGAIGSHKDYTPKGKIVFLLLWLFSVIFYTGAVVALTIMSGYMILGIIIWEIIKLVCLPLKPLTSRITWSKLKFKVKK